MLPFRCANKPVVGEIEGRAEVEKGLSALVDKGANWEVGDSCGLDVLGRILVRACQKPNIVASQAGSTPPACTVSPRTVALVCAAVERTAILETGAMHVLAV
jgi:hypothetical protein